MDKFIQDTPRTIAEPTRVNEGVNIDGVVLEQLTPNEDYRGSLTELITLRDGEIAPIVHVYQVIAKAGSVRGWVYHKWQHDRLVYTQGDFQIELYDTREKSTTHGNLMVLRVGLQNPSRLTIPPLVAHRVTNLGETAAFLNFPTRLYDPNNPDKFRYQGLMESSEARPE